MQSRTSVAGPTPIVPGRELTARPQVRPAGRRLDVREAVIAGVYRGAMPVICSFYGIDIKMYFRDHFPPHFHAYYGEHSAEVAIDDLRILAGGLPRRALAFVREMGGAPSHRA